MPSSSSRNKSSSTCFCQNNGTGAGVWNAFAVVPSFVCISIGGPGIWGQGCWWHVLKVKEPKCCSSHLFIFSLFSSVHSNGSSFGCSGTTVCWGQEHRPSHGSQHWWFCWQVQQTPPFCCGVVGWALWVSVVVAPTLGKFLGIMARSIIFSMDMYIPFAWWLT